jgi:hypothetical protein
LAAIPCAAQSVTADLSQGATFKFKIGPGLPDFTFKIVPNVRPNDEHGNAESTVQDVEVYKGDAKRPIQHLEDCNFDDQEPPLRGVDWFRAEDLNFDGYNDIYLLVSWGATGNQYGCVWLYNPVTGSFDYSKEFSELSRFWVDPARKMILTFDRGGMLGQVHDANRYKVDGNKLVLVMHEHQDWDFDRKQFHCVVEERKGATMTTVRDEWSKPSDDWIKAEAPCDAATLFEGFTTSNRP